MILKYFEIKKTNFANSNFFLLYGSNKGLIEETIENLKKKINRQIYSYEESEIINNLENFYESILNKTFFDNQKLIIIKRVSDKIYKIIEEIISKNIGNISIILTSEKLDKKSKLRIFFEKNLNTLCIPFYEDNTQILSLIANNFIKEKKINLSQQNLNLIIDRAKGDRSNLKNELEKIELLAKTQGKIDINHILKLSNLSENYDFSELIDSSLSKNKKKLIKILNENNFASEDCIIILRILLSKLKRLLKIKALYRTNRNVEVIINQYKPPIFWKEKEIIKQQINIWSYEKIKDLIIETNNIEYLIKKNPQIAIISTTNFVLNSAA